LAATSPRDTIITVTDAAMAKLKELRSTEPDAEKLGLRLSVVSQPGEDFRYDLVFEEFLKSAFTDEVRTIDGFKFIIPGNDVDSLRGAELDYNEQAGLVLRNPNRPKAPQVEGLVRDDATSAQIEAIVSAEVNPALAAHARRICHICRSRQGRHCLLHDGRRLSWLFNEQADDARRCANHDYRASEDHYACPRPHRPHHGCESLLSLKCSHECRGIHRARQPDEHA
jgi:Fe/S biogenesis protein NfuA